MSTFDYGSMGYDPNYAGGVQFPPLTPPPPVPTENSGGGFGEFLNSRFMSNVGGPLLATGLSGLFTNQAARNYEQSAYQATAIGALAGKEAGFMNFGLGQRAQDLAQQRRYDDAKYRLNQMKSNPFHDLRSKEFRMQIASRDAPASGMLAGRFHTMFA